MSRPPSRLSEGSSTRGKRPPSRESADAFVNSASFAIKKEPSPKPVGKPSVTAADEAREGWSGAEIVTQKLRRPPADEKLIEDKELAWVGLASYVEENIKEQSHEELRAVDARRKSLLELARNTSASSTLFKLWQLPRTVLPRLVKKPLIWLVLLTFVCGAIVSRFELLSEENVAEAAALDTERGATTVTFMVVFYVGYCYSRSNQQFDDVQLIMHSINDACLIARVTFEDNLEVHRLWRYLNMLHAAAYCGLTDELTEGNFFFPACDKFGLLSQGEVQDEELAAINRIRIDDSGSRACSMFEVWAFEVIKGEAMRAGKGAGTLSPPVHVRLMGEINNVSISIKRLFAYRYQVLPYIYTHLVSLSCALFLFRSVFLVSLEFTPDSSIAFGLVVPAIDVLAQIIATFGLIEVGETILDPFGNDPEDYALLHFVEVTAVSSHEAIKIEPCGVRVRERERFYNPVELIAANKVVRGMIRKYRWRKILQQARAHADFEERCKWAPSSLLDKRGDPQERIHDPRKSSNTAAPSNTAPSNTAPSNGLSSAELRTAVGTAAQGHSADHHSGRSSDKSGKLQNDNSAKLPNPERPNPARHHQKRRKNPPPVMTQPPMQHSPATQPPKLSQQPPYHQYDRHTMQRPAQQQPATSGSGTTQGSPPLRSPLRGHQIGTDTGPSLEHPGRVRSRSTPPERSSSPEMAGARKSPIGEVRLPACNTSEVSSTTSTSEASRALSRDLGA